MEKPPKNVMSGVIDKLYGPEKPKAPIPSRVTVTHDIWTISERTKLASKAYLSAVSAENEAAVMLSRANHAKLTAYAILHDLECELEEIEKKSNMSGATRFYTIDKEEEGEDESI